MVLVVETGEPLPIATARLAQSVADRPRIEPAAGMPSDRRMIGHVDGIDVHLSVWDANVLTRRKSWNIEFEGAFESTANGAVLRGAIDIPDRTQLNAMLWIFRILALGLEIRDISQGHAPVLWPVAGAILLCLFVVLAVRRMETEGGRHAEDDAHVLTTAVSRTLRG